MSEVTDEGSVKARDIQSGVVAMLESNLGLSTNAISAHPDTRLLGAIPELDSMSVVAFLISLEEQYGITIYDDEVDAETFATLGSLSAFLESKLG